MSDGHRGENWEGETDGQGDGAHSLAHHARRQVAESDGRAGRHVDQGPAQPSHRFAVDAARHGEAQRQKGKDLRHRSGLGTVNGIVSCGDTETHGHADGGSRGGRGVEHQPCGQTGGEAKQRLG